MPLVAHSMRESEVEAMAPYIFVRVPSMQIMPTLGPIVSKQDLLWAIWWTYCGLFGAPTYSRPLSPALQPNSPPTLRTPSAWCQVLMSAVREGEPEEVEGGKRRFAFTQLLALVVIMDELLKEDSNNDSKHIVSTNDTSDKDKFI